MVVTTDASSHGWGGWWRPFGHSGKLHHETRGFELPSEEGMSSNAQELSGVKLTVKAGLEHSRNRLVLMETDNEVTQAYINHLGGRSPFLSSIAQDLWSICYQAHILLVAVHRPKQGECTSKSLISLEAGPHRHPAQPRSPSPDRPTVRPTLGRPPCDPGQHFARPLCVLEARSIGDRRRCLHVPDEGR